MSRRPVMKTSTTKSSRTLTGGTKITTTTNATEVQPYGGASCTMRGRSTSGRGTCPGAQARAGTSIRPNASRTSLRSGTTTARRPSATSLARQRAPAPLKAPAPGQYTLPAPYGPQSRQGRGQAYSSPIGLRAQMESKTPKALRYETVKGGVRAKGRPQLQGTRMQDTFSGGFNVYGAPKTTREMVPEQSLLNEKISNDTAEHILAIGSEDVEAVEDEVTQELFSKSMLDQHEKVYCRGHHISEIKQQMITTPAGLEPVIQQAYTERKLERDMGGEKLVKNLSVVEMDECSGKGIKVIISEQQLDPDFGLSSEGTDTVTVRETISVTPSYTSTARDVTHEVTKPKLEIDPAEVARLVQEENEDVENTLKIAPPDLVLTEEKYGIKKRLQQLRLNSESMALIEEAVISPTVNADEALGETTPEAIVQIMHTVESGVAPECAPDQVFHTLFEDKPTEQSVVLSSIGPGPLQDVVVPQQLILDLQKEPLSTDLNKLTDIYKNVTDAEDWPHVDVFASVMEEEQKHPNKGVQSRPFKPIADEEVPWGEEDLEPLVNIVGAEPVSVLDPFNVSELQESGNFEKELTHGIEYFIDADPVQYMSRVQLRGSHPPPWFPGYIYALPDFPDVVKVARNPDEVFLGSWKACQPKILPEESITIMP